MAARRSSSRLHGIDGTLQIVRQLEGYEIPAFAWESQILPARVAGYRPEFLDRLCYAGDVMWGRLTPHPAFEPRDAAESRRVRPTRLAPIALFLRANADELIVRRRSNVDALSHAALEMLEQIELLRAPFFAEIVRATKRLPSEVEEALWQLVAAGLVTADGFDALRSLSDAKRRLGEKGLRARPRSSSGRWTLLQATTVRIDATHSRAVYSRAGAWSFATSSRARAWRRRGANCCWPFAGWRRAARFAAAVSSRDSWANSLRFRRRSTHCAPCAAPAQSVESVTARRLRSAQLAGIITRRKTRRGAGINTACRSARLNRSR